jgi:hypothetical protein
LLQQDTHYAVIASPKQLKNPPLPFLATSAGFDPIRNRAEEH